MSTTPVSATTVQSATGATTTASVRLLRLSDRAIVDCSRWRNVAKRKRVSSAIPSTDALQPYEEEEEEEDEERRPARAYCSGRRGQMSTTERRLQDDIRCSLQGVESALAKAEQWLWTKEATQGRSDARWKQRSRWLRLARETMQMGAMQADRAVDGRETFY